MSGCRVGGHGRCYRLPAHIERASFFGRVVLRGVDTHLICRCAPEAKALKQLDVIAVSICAVAWMTAGARAADAPRCYAPSELAARPGEEHPVKGDRSYDQEETSRALAPFAPLATELRGAIRRVELPKGKKLIALTLDLCEQTGEIAGYEGAIFDYLRAQGVKATLFTGGKWMRSHDARFRQLMSDPLFEIGNHAAAHRNLRLLTGTALDTEITGPQRAYEAIRADASGNQCLAPKVTKTPARINLFRFPYGACNDASLAAVNDAGLMAIQWDVSTGDPSPGTTAQQIADEMIHGVKPGSIIIAHANGRGVHTAAGLPLAIPKLKAMGYQFVTVGELLAAGKPVVVSSCYNSKPGDTDRYDHPLALIAKAKPRATGTSMSEILPWLTQTAPTPSPARSAPRRAAVPQPRERLPWE
jgi:peptidoglycan-N-acetylglucosamine deacetylase